MKKIYIILMIILIQFQLGKIYSYEKNNCSFEKLCSSYFIGKVSEKPHNEVIENEGASKYDFVSTAFFLEKNRFFSLDKPYISTELTGKVLTQFNRLSLSGEIINDFYLPKKNDIIIYGDSENIIGGNNFMENIYNQKFYKQIINIEYINNLLKNDINDNYVNLESNNFNIIYCKNDNIYIKTNNERENNIYLPVKKGVDYGKGKVSIPYRENDNFLNSINIFPKANKIYTEKDLITDLQYLAPCSNFNKIFGLNDNSNKIKEVNEEKINLKENKNILLEYFYKFIDFLKNLF